jgi:hypothetical protein
MVVTPCVHPHNTSTISLWASLLAKDPYDHHSCVKSMKCAGLHNGLSKFDNGRPKLPRVKLQEINASQLKFLLGIKLQAIYL